jgi:hypothetical protein
MAEQEDDVLERLLEDGIKREGQAIATIWVENELPVLVFELAPGRKDRAHFFGWDGNNSVFPIAPEARAELVARLRSLPQNPVAKHYADIIEHQPAEMSEDGMPIACHLVALVAGGLVLVKFDPARGYSIELGGLTSGEVS